MTKNSSQKGKSGASYRLDYSIAERTIPNIVFFFVLDFLFLVDGWLFSISDVFASVGLEFIGRNYAMGGTAAGPEISMCWQEIFGTDVDFVSWDYGMTDGNAIAKMLHYLYRGGSVRAGPPCCASMVGDGPAVHGKRRRSSSKTWGLPPFMGNPTTLPR